MEVKIDSKCDVFFESKHLSAHASPTTTLKTDLVLSFGGDTAKPLVVNKCVLVDTGGSERDSATVSSTAWTFTDGANYSEAVQTVEVTITANYTIAKVRLYAGTTLYFEYTLPSTISVTSGSKVRVTMTIRVTGTLSHTAGGTLVEIGFLGGALRNGVLKRFLTGEFRGQKVEQLYLYSGGVYVTMITGTVSTDTTNLRAISSFSYTPTTSVTIDEYQYHSPQVTFIYVKIQSITLSGGVTHTWSLTIQF